MPFVTKYRKVVCTTCLGAMGWWIRQEGKTVWVACEVCMGVGKWDEPYTVWEQDNRKKKKDQDE